MNTHMCAHTHTHCSVVVMLCGGNIDTAILGRCLERGLAADGRMATFKVVLEDRSGSVSGLTHLLSDLKCRYTHTLTHSLTHTNIFNTLAWISLSLFLCSVKDIVHERTWLQASIHHVEVGK